MIVKINAKDLSFLDAEKFCLLEYPHHPKGCPNYGKKKGCPPNVSPLSDILDLSKEIYLIYTEFDIREHAEKMRKLHPNWSNSQVYCCLYWQPKARKLQRLEEGKAMKEKNINIIITCPEGRGVNIISLMNNKAGIKLEWPPRNITRIVSLGGTKK